MSNTKQLSVRMPVDIVRQLLVKGKSSRFIVDAVREKLERDAELELEAGLACLADDPEANDISDLGPAQAKVIARGD
jgi:hypothetical protein